MNRLKDIAERVGCSVMTVSRVMRNLGNVAPQTREKVLRVARELGYVPDAGARALRTRSTALVGVIVRELAEPPWGEIVSRLQGAAAARGLDCLLACSHGRPEEEERLLARMVGRRPQGLFLQPAPVSGEVGGIYRALVQERVWLVVLGDKPAHLAGFPGVRADDAGAMRALVGHLVSLGHQRIGFLAGPTLMAEARRRTEAFQNALRRHGLEPRDRWIFSAGADVAGGAEAARAFLREGADCTALVAHHDLVAMGAARVLREAGRRIPEDISLAGFGNQPCAAWFEPPLTTVDLRPTEFAAAAARLMEAMLAGRPAVDVVVEGRLVVRASVGPPPKAAAGTGSGQKAE